MSKARPHGRLFHEQATEVVWSAICALDEGAQHEVLDHLRERLGVAEVRDSPQGARVARGVRGLRMAAELLGGRSPSMVDYRRLRRERSDLELPPDGSVRRWLGGSWNDALNRARLDAVPEADASVVPLGSKLSAEELVVGIQACADELGRIPGLHDYLAWARRPDIKRRPGRRARSQSPFVRMFGSWWKAQVAAGLAESEEQAIEAGGGRGAYRYTDEQIFEALEEVRIRLGGRSPSHDEYTAHREQVREESEAQGALARILPAHTTLVRRFGSWRGACRAHARWRQERDDGPRQDAGASEDGKEDQQDAGDAGADPQAGSEASRA